MKIKQSEKQIQDSIIEYLQLKRFYVQRLNAGSYQTKNGGFVRGVANGTPDILAFRDMKITFGATAVTRPIVQLYFIEVKAGKNKPTEIQLSKQQELAQYGAVVINAWSLEDVQKVI